MVSAIQMVKRVAFTATRPARGPLSGFDFRKGIKLRKAKIAIRAVYGLSWN